MTPAVALCSCGCGQQTALARRTDTAKGWRRGHPLRFVRGHALSAPVAPPYRVPDPDGGDAEVYAVPLRGEKAAGRVTLIDAQDLALVAGHRWHLWERERPGRRLDGPYALAEDGTRLHKLLTGWDETDHRNGDGLDNRRGNLRSANGGVNARNQRPVQGSSSRFKGVFWFARDSKWVAQINIDGRSRHLGYYVDEEAAARAYDVAAVEAWGDEANPNFGGWGAAEEAEATR